LQAVEHPDILLGRGHVHPTLPSVYLLTIEIDIKHQRKIIASLFWGGMASSASFWQRYCFQELTLNYDLLK